MFPWTPYQASAQLSHSSDLSELEDGIIEAKRGVVAQTQTPAPAPLPPHRPSGRAKWHETIVPVAANGASGAVAATIVRRPQDERIAA